MRSWRTSLSIVVLLATGLAAAQVLPREVRTRILEAVVEIAPYDDAAGRFAGTGGSGTIISPDGFVLTNFHVIGDDVAGTHFTWHAIFVTDPSNPDRQTEHRYWARFVAGDARHDLALVKIELLADESALPPGIVFTSMPIGDSNALIPGDPITVVGYPGIGGFTVTVTTGIVSGWLGEDLESGGKGWIKTDARIAGGNSGGGAFDEEGRLVAVPTSRVQTNEGAFEEQNLLRPVALALPLIAAHVSNVERAGGIASLRPQGAAAPGATSPTPSTPGGAGGSDGLVRGSLAPGDETLPSGEFLKLHDWNFTAGVAVELTLRSSVFDPYLVVIDPAGDIVLEVDDSPGEGLDVRETLVPDRSGSYTLVVTSAYPGETGAYELSVRTGSASAAPAPSAPLAPPPQADPFGSAARVDASTQARANDPSFGTVGVVPIGARIAGRLASSADVAYHTYVVEVPTGTSEISFVMDADADLDLVVKHGSDILGYGDDGDWDARDVEFAHHATLRIPAPRPGTWYVDVVFYPIGPPQTASYTFEVR